MIRFSAALGLLLVLAGCTTTTTSVSTVPGLGSPPAEFNRHAQPAD